MHSSVTTLIKSLDSCDLHNLNITHVADCTSKETDISSSTFFLFIYKACTVYLTNLILLLTVMKVY